jgi:hypothetical protein
VVIMAEGDDKEPRKRGANRYRRLGRSIVNLSTDRSVTSLHHVGAVSAACSVIPVRESTKADPDGAAGSAAPDRHALARAVRVDRPKRALDAGDNRRGSGCAEPVDSTPKCQGKAGRSPPASSPRYPSPYRHCSSAR